MASRLAVIAISGDSLIKDRMHQSVHNRRSPAHETTEHVASMVADGWNVIIGHGNGPQVGFILRRSELAAHELHEVPLDVCGANCRARSDTRWRRTSTTCCVGATSNGPSRRSSHRPRFLVTTQPSRTRRNRSARSWTRTRPVIGRMKTVRDVLADVDGIRAGRSLATARCRWRRNRRDPLAHRRRDDRRHGRRRWDPRRRGRRRGPFRRRGRHRQGSRLLLLARILHADLLLITTSVEKVRAELRHR